MNNIEAFKPVVKSSVDDVVHFATTMGERGDYTAATARNAVTAFTQLISVLQEEEPKDALSLRDSLEDIVRRYAVKNPNKKSETVNTYSSRVRSLLDDFISWSENPTQFKGRARRPTADSQTARGTKKTTSPTKKPDGSRRTGKEVEDLHARTYVLPGQGREISFAVPTDLSKSDVALFMCHLLTMAKDFHPADLQRFSFGEMEIYRGDDADSER